MLKENIPVSEQAYRSDVAELQNYLRAIIYGSGRKTTIVPDGVYGSSTRSEIEKFQSESGIEPTGAVDRITWDAVVEAYLDAINNTAAEQGILPFGSFENVLSDNDSGMLIVILQAMLRTISSVDINFPIVEISGIYDDKTHAFVKQFQLAAGIEPTGSTDIRTWNTLVRYFNFLAEEYG